MKYRSGFTFVEVLIAILLCALLIGVLTSVVIHVGHLDRRTLALRSTKTELQTIVCRAYLGSRSQKDLATKWKADVKSKVTGEDKQNRFWHSWTSRSGHTISLRAEHEQW